jgi:hypothetical protein
VAKWIANKDRVHYLEAARSGCVYPAKIVMIDALLLHAHHRCRHFDAVRTIRTEMGRNSSLRLQNTVANNQTALNGELQISQSF